jgi:hypothetical protein
MERTAAVRGRVVVRLAAVARVGGFCRYNESKQTRRKARTVSRGAKAGVGRPVARRTEAGVAGLVARRTEAGIAGLVAGRAEAGIGGCSPFENGDKMTRELTLVSAIAAVRAAQAAASVRLAIA